MYKRQDAFATGHYISSREDGQGGRALFRAKEAARDQGYFLFTATKPQLDLLRFPLGDLPKAEVREMARRFGLIVADKPDSQDICFVPAGKYTDIIERLQPNAIVPGDIRHVDGRVLGRHAGVVHYTIGQRRGLGPVSYTHLDVYKGQTAVFAALLVWRLFYLIAPLAMSIPVILLFERSQLKHKGEAPPPVAG